MGDRGQVQIVLDKTHSVYLYTHWGAHDLIETVHKAIKRGVSRYTDVEYLARIIFNEITADDEMGLTGAGIEVTKHGDVWRVITVDPEADIITIIDYDKLIWKGNHNEFLDADLEILAKLASGEEE